MPQCQLLVVRKTIDPSVSFACSSVLVVYDAMSETTASQDEAKTLEAQIDCMACMEEWRVCGQICPSVE